MAAFSSSSSFHHHHQPSFLLDSLFLPNSTIDETSNPPKNLHQQQPTIFNHQNLIHQNHSMDNSSSIVTDQKHDENSSEYLTQNLITPMEKKRKCKQASSANSAQSKDKREVLRGKKQKKVKDDEEKNKNSSNSKENNKAAEEKGFIHVRARRGQATDSHSLAERVRRERISERMKLLQTLVPGCDKVTGKALMLDEIINYVQSLQNQVEFLSMKLASVNPMFYDFGVDLESFMVRPDQDLSELPSPLASMQECSPTISTNNNYNNFVIENSANHHLLFQQSQVPTTLLPHHPQGSRQGLWEVDEHRQKILNQSGFNNSLFSFH